jgi:glycosyltransferase involved in cell wall biosynthesis
MRVLAVTNMMPSERNPKAGTFIAEQLRGLSEIGLNIEVLLCDRATLGPATYRKVPSAVREAIRRTKPDLIHFMYGGALAALGLPAAKGLPRVVSFCGVDLLGAGYGPMNYRLRTGAGRLASLAAARMCDQIIVKSQNLADGLPKDLRDQKTTIIPNGVSLQRFRPMDESACRERLGWASDRFHVLFSTRDRSNEKKRLALAEAAVALLEKKGVAAELHGLWRTPHEDVPVWINAADVLLFTSREDEGSPNIVKETLACRRPVVSVDVGDVKERLNGIAGCYIADPEPSDLAEKLHAVVEGNRRVDSLGPMMGLTVDAIARRVREVYERAIRNRACS